MKSLQPPLSIIFVISIWITYLDDHLFNEYHHILYRYAYMWIYDVGKTGKREDQVESYRSTLLPWLIGTAYLSC